METHRLLTFLLGALMAVLLAVVSCAVMIWSPLRMFPEIQHACRVTHQSQTACSTGAHAAGISMVAAFVLLMIAAVWAAHHRSAIAGPLIAIPSLATISLLVFCFTLFALHLIEDALLPAYANRIEELNHVANHVSLENLLWPLLTQLLLLERDWRLRTAMFSALLLIVSLTPYRSVDLAILSFSVVLPFAYLLYNAQKAAWPRAAVRATMINLILVVSVAGAIGWHGWVDTRARSLESASAESTAAETTSLIVQLDTIDRFRQRLIYPFYQAAIVSGLAKTTALPTILDEFQRKFRATRKPNLDEFIYSMIYPGGAGIGEATTLYYGEGWTYFGKAGIIWALGAPLLFVVAWIALSKMRLEVSALLSIGLWRSSFAGLITVLPALVLQVLTLLIMTRADKLVRSKWLNAPGVLRVATGLLLIAVLVTAAAQVWTTIEVPQKDTLAEATLAAANGCVFDLRDVDSLPNQVDAARLAPGHAIRSSLIAATQTRIDLLLPYGHLVGQHLPQLASVASSVTKCNSDGRSSPVQVVDVKSISGYGSIPLDLLALFFTLLTAFSLGSELLGMGLSPPLRITDWLASAEFGPGSPSKTAQEPNTITAR